MVNSVSVECEILSLTIWYTETIKVFVIFLKGLLFLKKHDSKSAQNQGATERRIKLCDYFQELPINLRTQKIVKKTITFQYLELGAIYPV
jgi:hypothetical protein